MIHSPKVIDRIKDLLILSGASSDEVIEEMTDHYLSEIEFAVSLGTQEQKAIRDAYQSLAKTDLKTLESTPYKKEKWIVGIALVIMAVLIIFNCSQSRNENSTLKVNQKIPISRIITPPSAWPIETVNFDVTSGYGMRNHPPSQTKRFHKGIDIRAKKGTPVLATGNGIAQEVSYNKSSGNYIVIKHNEIFSTRYTHLLNTDIEEGIQVVLGDKIGEVGNSGMSISPHLHYEVIKNDKVIDPMEVLRP